MRIFRVLAAEQAQVMPSGTNAWAVEAAIEPASVVVERLPPNVAKERFLARYRLLVEPRF